MGRLRALLHAQPASATRNATAQPQELRVAHSWECNAQPAENEGSDDPLPEPAAEARRQRVLSMLVENSTLRLAVVCDGEGDPVPVAIGIRDKGTCEVHIPASRFDPFALLELVERHGGALH